MESTITSKGQITIPKEARDTLKVGPGDRVRFFFDAYGNLSIRPTSPGMSLKGIVKSRLSRPVTREDIKQAAEEGAVERYERAVGKK